MPDYENPSPVRARSSVKSLNYELTNLSPSSVVTLFEIDISKVVESKSINLPADASLLGLKDDTVQDGIIRFHNNIKVFNSYIVWQGKTYWPAPITAQGFETTSKGTLPQPTLSISSQSETGNDQLALLKYEIKRTGDIIGSKVTRRRTFAKYLDRINFGGTQLARIGRSTNMLPDGYEPDPFAYLPSDVYFIERKQTENKSNLVYQLSSILDLEGIKLPKRIILADKCVWQYRGIGCWYQNISDDEIKDYPSSLPPVLDKAELLSIKESTDETVIADAGTPAEKKKACGLPFLTPPAATDADEDIRMAAAMKPTDDLHPMGEFAKYKDPNNNSGVPNDGYKIGDYVYILKDKIKYYFVCKEPNGTPTVPLVTPPNKTYWVADECSKSLTGCRKRWGADTGKVKMGAGYMDWQEGELPYGGFPAAKKMSRLS